MSSSGRAYDDDGGKPLGNFTTSDIDLSTVSPTFGVVSQRNKQKQPDYLDYEQNRGVMVTMFANAGASYLLGISAGGLYGLREGLTNTPSSRFKVKLNSVLNHCGRHGSRAGNVLGVLSVVFSLYQGAADGFELDRYLGSTSAVPAFAAFMTGATYKATAGPRVAGLAGAIGLGAVGATYGIYTVLGIPYGSKGYLFF